MTVLAQRIDVKITRGMSFTVKIPGRIKTYDSAGRLYQNFLSAQPVHMYDLAHGLRSRDDFQLVLDAFYVCMFNGYEGCLIKDWRDFIATQNNTSCAVIDSTHLQLQRKHSFGTASWARAITRPLASPVPAIYRNRGGTITSITYSLDYTTGIAGIVGHVTGDTYTWTGEFDVPVAFSNDDWTGTLEVSTTNLYISSNPIPLEELIP